MEHSSADLSLFGKVANKGGGLFVGQEITTNIRLSRCDEIDALRHKGAVAVGLDRRSQLPRAALNRHAADGLATARRTTNQQ